jgi:hypothetical protein
MQRVIISIVKNDIIFMENQRYQETPTADAAMRFLQQRPRNPEAIGQPSITEPLTGSGREIAAELAWQMDAVARMVYQKVSEQHPYLADTPSRSRSNLIGLRRDKPSFELRLNSNVHFYGLQSLGIVRYGDRGNAPRAPRQEPIYQGPCLTLMYNYMHAYDGAAPYTFGVNSAHYLTVPVHGDDASERDIKALAMREGKPPISLQTHYYFDHDGNALKTSFIPTAIQTYRPDINGFDNKWKTVQSPMTDRDWTWAKTALQQITSTVAAAPDRRGERLFLKPLRAIPQR